MLLVSIVLEPTTIRIWYMPDGLRAIYTCHCNIKWVHAEILHVKPTVNDRVFGTEKSINICIQTRRQKRRIRDARNTVRLKYIRIGTIALNRLLYTLHTIIFYHSLPKIIHKSISYHSSNCFI